LGKPNHPNEHYRNSFFYLAYGRDTIEEGITNFTENEKNNIRFFRESVIIEIIGHLFEDEYALKFLKIFPEF